MRPSPLLKVLLTTVVVGFVAWTAWDLAGRWAAAPAVVLHGGWLGLAFVPVVGVSLAQALGWHSLLQHMAGRRLPASRSMELFLASMLGRYAPAKVGMPAVLMSRAQPLGLTAALTAAAMMLVVLVYAVEGAGIGLGVLLLTAGSIDALLPAAALPTALGGVVLGAMTLVVALLLAVDRRRYPAFVRRGLKAGGQGPWVGPGVVGWYALVWAQWWIHGFVLIQAVGGDGLDGVRAAGLFVLAPVVGFLAVVAPGGLGVREAVVAVGVQSSLGPGPAVVAALASRVMSLGADVLVWLVFRALVRRSPAGPEAAGDGNAPDSARGG